MLVGRTPVALVGDRVEIPSTTQLFGTAALGHPALHLCDVASLRSRDEDALDAQASEFLGHFRTSRRVQRWSCHAGKAIPTHPVLRTLEPSAPITPTSRLHRPDCFLRDK